jgi:hypothetical protein
MDVRVHTSIATALEPAEVLATLLDFTPRRTALWPRLEPSSFAVHDRGDTWAIVTEGNRSPRVQARLRYDWAVPGTVTWTVLDSDFCTPGDAIRAVVRPRPVGGSVVELDWRRRPTSVRGYLIALLYRVAGPRLLRRGFTDAFDRVAAGPQRR